MSDFLFSTRRREPGELYRALKRYLAPVAPEIVQTDGSWGSLAVARGPHDPPSVAMDDGRYLSVLIGEPIVRIAPESPGLSWRGERRRAVHEMLKTGGEAAWDDRLDGHFAALGIDRESGAGCIVTDLFAFVSVFVSTDAEGGLVIGTHVDAVARAAGRNRDVDLVSAADFAATLTCTFPHTLYRGVEQAMPGTERRFTTGGWTDAGRTFWRPEERNPFASVGDAAEALREAIAEDVRVVSEGVPEIGLLLSGGEDSRAVLGAVPPGVRVRSFIYADWESREVRIARAVARAHGSELEVGERAPGHYLDGFRDVAGMIGAHHLFTDVHGYGFHDRLDISRVPVVLGGLSSDSLLKAEYTPGPRHERKPVRVAREPMMREELLAEVDARRTRFRDWLAGFRPESADEWAVLWPFSMRKHGGNLDGNRRVFRSHEVYHATAVVKIAAAVPAAWKVNRRLFRAAVRPFFATTRFVPHARLRYPAFGPLGNALLVPGLVIARTARGLAKGEIRRRQQPWPRWSSLSGSEGAERERRATPLLQSPLRDLFASESAGEVEGAVRGWYPLRQLILLQLTYLTARAGED